MTVPKSNWSRPFRQMRHLLTTKIFGAPGPLGYHLKRILSRNQFRVTAGGRKKVEQKTDGRLSIPNLFERKDQVHQALAAQQLQWYGSPPIIYHDLLLAAAKVGRVEDRIKYTFSDKMTCIEALKITSSVTPLYFKGVIQKVDKNNRLALLGDRALSLALCEIWFHTGNSTGEYGIMFQTTETRAALYAKAHQLGIHKEVLLYDIPTPTNDQVAETFEAIIGAVYLDCGNNIDVVKRVITGMDLDTHKYLTTQSESKNLQEKKELLALRAAEQRVRRREATEALARQALELRNQTKKTESFTMNQLRENTATAPVNATPTKAAPVNATPTKTASINATPTKAVTSTAAPEKQRDLPKSPVSNKGSAKSTQKPDEPANSATSAAVKVASKTVESPLDDDANITADLLGDWKPTDTKSWKKIERGIKNHAWMVAVAQTKSLKKKGRPADIQALYQTKLRTDLKVAAQRIQREVRKDQDPNTKVKAPQVKEEKSLNSTRDSSQPGQEGSQVSGDSQRPQKGQPAKSTTTTTAPEETDAEKVTSSLLTQDTADLSEKRETTSSGKSTCKESKKDKEERPKSLEELEREILDSHIDVWKATKTGQRGRSIGSRTRRILQQRVGEATEDVIPSSEEPSSEVLAKAESQSKNQPQKEPEIYESEIDKMLAGITQDENDKEAGNSGEASQMQDEAAPDTKQNPSSQPKTKSNKETATSPPEASVKSRPESKAEVRSWYTRYF